MRMQRGAVIGIEARVSGSHRSSRGPVKESCPGYRSGLGTRPRSATTTTVSERRCRCGTMSRVAIVERRPWEASRLAMLISSGRRNTVDFSGEETGVVGSLSVG